MFQLFSKKKLLSNFDSMIIAQCLICCPEDLNVNYYVDTSIILPILSAALDTAVPETLSI